MGLVACCDIAIASEQAIFCLSEVRLGLIPAVIAPYVVAAMGERAARRYFLTAERFSAEEALRIGLVHEVVRQEDLEYAAGQILRAVLAGGPSAQAAAKELVFAVSRRPTDRAVIEDTARRIAEIRVGAEGQEGIGAFLAKRKPSWVNE